MLNDMRHDSNKEKTREYNVVIVEERPRLACDGNQLHVWVPGDDM